MYCSGFVRVQLSGGVNVIAAAPAWPWIGLPSVYIRTVPGFMALCSLMASSADGLMQAGGGVHHSATTCDCSFSSRSSGMLYLRPKLLES